MSVCNISLYLKLVGTGRLQLQCHNVFRIFRYFSGKKHGDFWFGKTQIYIKMQDEKGYNTITN